MFACMSYHFGPISEEDRLYDQWSVTSYGFKQLTEVKYIVHVEISQALQKSSVKA